MKDKQIDIYMVIYILYEHNIDLTLLGWIMG
jgi:hypothetical protein